jgi:hypothetical protein
MAERESRRWSNEEKGSPTASSSHMGGCGGAGLDEEDREEEGDDAAAAPPVPTEGRMVTTGIPVAPFSSFRQGMAPSRHARSPSNTETMSAVYTTS